MRRSRRKGVSTLRPIEIRTLTTTRRAAVLVQVTMARPAVLNAFDETMRSPSVCAVRGLEIRRMPEPVARVSLYTFHMVARFRSAVMWLLLLALPLQGVAAVTMLNCGPNHHHLSAASGPAPTEAHHHATHEQHQHGIGVAEDHDEMASTAVHDGSPSAHHLDKLMKFKCSACAACCIGAAMPATAIALKPLRPAMRPDSFVPAPHVGFVTDGPDRPPRPSLV